MWYQVHTKSGWLPKVSGYDIDDLENGYAGNGSKIDAIRVYYTTPQSIAESLNKYLVAKYKVSAISKEYLTGSTTTKLQTVRTATQDFLVTT